MSFRRGPRGVWDEYDCDADVPELGAKPERISGWKYNGVKNTKAGLLATFHYSVATLIDGQYQEDPVLSQTVMSPSRLAYTLPQLESLKAEKLFIISVPEKIMDQGIQGLRARIALEQAEAEAARNVVLEPEPAYEEELELKVA